MKRNARHYLLFATLLVLFGVFLIWPIFQVFRVGLFGFVGHHFTLAYVASVFEDHSLRSGLINSTLISVFVTLLSCAIALPLAWIASRFEFPLKRFLTSLLLVPLVLPPFVGAIGLRQILGRFGMLTSICQSLNLVAVGHPIDWLGVSRLSGIILVESLSLYPIIFLNVSAAMSNLDPQLEQAAANLGASRWRVLRRITFPLIRPGLLAGATIVMIWSFTELGTPLMFDFYQATPVQVFHRITQVASNPLPYALTLVMLLGSAILYAASKAVLGRSEDAAVTKASTQRTFKRLRGMRAIVAMLAFIIVISLALLPHMGVVLMSFSGIGKWYQSVIPTVFTVQHFQVALAHPLVLPSAANSIRFACASVAIDLIIGMTIAWLIVRSDIVGKRFLDSLAMLPLAVPGLVMAFGYLAISIQFQTWFKDIRWLRNAVDVTENPTLLLVVAYAMRRLPYVVRSAVAGLQQTPRDLELAAHNLGAKGFTTLRRITVPLISANLFAGGLLAFAFALLEVSDSLVLAQKESYWPITKAIYDLYTRLGDGPYIAAALGVWMMLVLALAILAAQSFLGARVGGLFRV